MIAFLIDFRGIIIQILNVASNVRSSPWEKIMLGCSKNFY